MAGRKSAGSKSKKKKAGKRPARKRPTAAQKREAESARAYQEKKWAEEQAKRQKTKTKKLMRGLTPEKVEELKQYETLHPLVVRKKVELAIVESLPELSKKASLEPLIDLKFELRKVTSRERPQISFENLIAMVTPMLEGQKERFKALEARTRGGPFHKRWDRRLKKVTDLLEKTKAYSRSVAEAGPRRGGTVNRIMRRQSVWLDFLKEAEDAFQFGLGAKESREFFDRQMAKVREHIKF
jgi:hypothetical protein